MIQLDNQTAWSAGLYPGWTRDGKRQHTLIFKISHQFSSDGTLSLLPSIPIIEADCYRQIPQSSSLSAVNELAPFKQGGEVYLYGSAQPYGKNGTTLQVILGLCRGNNHFWTKELRVFGERLWQRKLFGHLPSHPEVISHAVPLIYEHAYGGSDPAHPEQVYTENPSGVGYSLRGLRTKGLRLPRIEQGPDFISSPASRVKPAGYGPLPPSGVHVMKRWEPSTAMLLLSEAVPGNRHNLQRCIMLPHRINVSTPPLKASWSSN